MVGHEHKRLAVQVVAEMGDSPYYRQSFSLITGVDALCFIVAYCKWVESLFSPVWAGAWTLPFALAGVMRTIPNLDLRETANFSNGIHALQSSKVHKGCDG